MGVCTVWAIDTVLIAPSTSRQARIGVLVAAVNCGSRAGATLSIAVHTVTGE
jgi:hypothetical protein